VDDPFALSGYPSTGLSIRLRTIWALPGAAVLALVRPTYKSFQDFVTQVTGVILLLTRANFISVALVPRRFA
jgi:hypothetical protein